MWQPFFIDSIIEALNLQNDSKVHDTPATEVLASDKKVVTFSENSTADLYKEYSCVSLSLLGRMISMQSIQEADSPTIQKNFMTKS